MNILALDTTTGHGSLALSCRGKDLRQREMPSADGFSHILFEELHEFLAEGVRCANIDLFVAASGPGSFTGVRVGLATVKALAEATGQGALGVSNLQALASFGTGPLRAVLIDARRNECYAAVYDRNLMLRSAEVVGNPATWLDSLPDGSYEFISQSSPWLQALLRPTRFSQSVNVEAPLYIASAIARCAELAIARGASTDPVALDANYVRRSDVNLYWHDREV